MLMQEIVLYYKHFQFEINQLVIYICFDAYHGEKVCQLN
jgi:hypothetical protein